MDPRRRYSMSVDSIAAATPLEALKTLGCDAHDVHHISRARLAQHLRWKQAGATDRADDASAISSILVRCGGVGSVWGGRQCEQGVSPRRAWIALIIQTATWTERQENPPFA